MKKKKTKKKTNSSQFLTRIASHPRNYTSRKSTSTLTQATLYFPLFSRLGYITSCCRVQCQLVSDFSSVLWLVSSSWSLDSLLAIDPCRGSSKLCASESRDFEINFPSRHSFKPRKWQRNVKLRKGYVNIDSSSVLSLHGVQLHSCRFPIHFVGGESRRLDRLCRGTFCFCEI